MLRILRPSYGEFASFTLYSATSKMQMHTDFGTVIVEVLLSEKVFNCNFKAM